LLDTVKESNENPRNVPRILLDGSDSIGAVGALARVYLNIGSYWEQWNELHQVVIGFTPQQPFRWGSDGLGFRRLLHPNGVCLFGKWIVDTENPYSGYFREGTEALIVGRYSTCCTETRRSFTRSLSLVGKIYPTTDAQHSEPLETGDFITQQDLGGERSEYINDAILLNAPNVTPWRRGWGLPILLISGLVFKAVNREPAIRQLHTVAELGKAEDEPT